MNIKIFKGDLELDYKRFTFPGGEVGIKLDVENLKFFYSNEPLLIEARLQNSEDFIALAMIKNALHYSREYNVSVLLGYLPYGRQDRQCVNGESFSLKVFTKLLNSLDFQDVTIVDPHSDVSRALLRDNDFTITQLNIIQTWDEFTKRIMRGCLLVAPDAGSNKKISDIAKYFSHIDFIRADKLRDLQTGNIKETIVYADDLHGKDIVIVDDVIDGARTFIELAKVLKSKNSGKVILYGTHGIFSKGVDIIYDSGIDEIWTTNTYRETYDPRVNVLNIRKAFQL